MPEPLRIRGMMLDAARLVESPEYYRRFIDFCADWDVNAIIFRLTDNQGCAMKFASHPELLTHPNALTPEEIGALVRHARGRGVELIPEVESFGHSQYITRVAQHGDLSDKEPGDSDWREGLIPLHPRVMQILEDLYREVASVFSGPYFHGGCDEVAWGKSAYSREMLASRSQARLWGEYMSALNGIARGLGKEFIIWGDHVLRQHPEILDHMDQSIIIHDWEYTEMDPQAVARMTERALQKGFRVIGGPALTWCKWGPRVGRDQLRNIDAFADAYRGNADPRVLGVICTNWVPGRYLPLGIWDGLAYAADAMSHGGEHARTHAFRDFVERHYGAPWSPQWADVFQSVYAFAPNRRCCSPAWMRPFLPLPWGCDDDVKAALSEELAPSAPLARLAGQVNDCAGSIRTNRTDFDSFAVTVDYLAHIHWRAEVIRERLPEPRDNSEALSSLLRTIADRDKRLYERLRAAWNAGRSPDTLETLRTANDLGPYDKLVTRFGDATAYSEELCAAPNRLARLRKHAGIGD